MAKRFFYSTFLLISSYTVLSTSVCYSFPSSLFPILHSSYLLPRPLPYFVDSSTLSAYFLLALSPLSLLCSFPLPFFHLPSSLLRFHLQSILLPIQFLFGHCITWHNRSSAVDGWLSDDVHATVHSSHWTPHWPQQSTHSLPTQSYSIYPVLSIPQPSSPPLTHSGLCPIYSFIHDICAYEVISVKW